MSCSHSCEIRSGDRGTSPEHPRQKGASYVRIPATAGRRKPRTAYLESDRRLIRVFIGAHAFACPGSENCAGGMVSGMATRKVTVTLDEVQLEQIRALVQAGTASSVSGFVQHAVAVALDDVAGWGVMLAEALRQTGGPLSDDERAWADDVLGTNTRPAA
jgi:Arc/MetJ-type ribon-helix-helix transcriptional regulator